MLTVPQIRGYAGQWGFLSALDAEMTAIKGMRDGAPVRRPEWNRAFEALCMVHGKMVPESGDSPPVEPDLPEEGGDGDETPDTEPEIEVVSAPVSVASVLGSIGLARKKMASEKRKLSPRQIIEWTAEKLGQKDVNRMECPDQTAWGYYQWAKKNKDVFWKDHWKILLPSRADLSKQVDDEVAGDGQVLGTLKELEKMAAEASVPQPKEADAVAAD